MRNALALTGLGLAAAVAAAIWLTREGESGAEAHPGSAPARVERDGSPLEAARSARLRPLPGAEGGATSPASPVDGRRDADDAAPETAPPPAPDTPIPVSALAPSIRDSIIERQDIIRQMLDHAPTIEDPKARARAYYHVLEHSVIAALLSEGRFRLKDASSVNVPRRGHFTPFQTGKIEMFVSYEEYSHYGELRDRRSDANGVGEVDLDLVRARARQALRYRP